MPKLSAVKLAQKTKDFSGADLKAVFDITIERSLAAAMREGRVIPITTDDLLQTTKSVKPSTRAWFDSAKNYAIYSNQGGFYDDVPHLSRHQKMSEPGGASSGFVQRGMLLKQQRRYGEAESFFRDALSQNPRDSYALMQLASCQLHIPGRERDALQSIDPRP